MSLIHRAAVLAAILGLVGCGGPPADSGDDTPPSGGNTWQIGDPSGCTDNDILTDRAFSACKPYGQSPANLHFITPCWAWYIGIAGPYAVQGAFFVSFQCR